MTPKTRNILAAVSSGIIGIFLACGIANESYALALLCIAVLMWLVIEWRGKARPEAWLLGVVFVGYIVGNRGFAQQSLSSQFPLLPAEMALLLAVPALLVRCAYRKTLPFRTDWLNIAILAWMLFGAARLPGDFRVFGFVAFRDFAMVYYAALFFAAQNLGVHENSFRFLRHAITAAFALLPAAYAGVTLFPGFFLDQLTLRGIPLIFQKSDLTATFFAAGFFWLWAQWEEERHWLWLLLALVNAMLIPLQASSRAAMVSMLVILVPWLFAGRFRILCWLGASGVVAACCVLFAAWCLKKDLRETPVYATYERAVSIFDSEGKRSYVHTDSGDPSDNNRFRLIWWRTVLGETVKTNPWTGLGWGYNLAEPFARVYNPESEEFSARSPHNVLITIFARAGLVTLLPFMVVLGIIGVRTLQAGRRGSAHASGLWCAGSVILVSACFGVVLEGPMGAVVFWTLLGLASATGIAERSANQGDAVPAAHEEPS